MSDYYGTDAQKAVLRRGRAVYELVRDDPACTYYGRGVGIMSAADAPEARLRALLTLQGTTSIAHVPPDAMEPVIAQMAELGAAVTRYERWVGGDRARKVAEAVIAATPLPRGLTLHELTEESPEEVFTALAGLAEACGVMLPNMAVLRGTLRPGTCFVALTEGGEAVSCAAGAAFAQEGHATREAWWGMLATAEAWRGHRLALLLGAHAIVSLSKKIPGCQIMTGVQPGNAPSEAVCSKLGLTPDGAFVATIVDPAAVPGGKLTS
ncbi:MAG: GNAT family N-acetyltransferase [Pseudomonadota bacterium]